MKLNILKNSYIILILLSITISGCIKVDTEVSSKIFFERREKLTPVEIRIVEDNWKKTGKWGGVIKPAEICVMDTDGKNLKVTFRKENNLSLSPNITYDGKKMET